MRKPASMWSLETLGRVRLSKSFYMRDFLYSEIGSFHRIPNIPGDPDLAILAGKHLCQELLEPLQDTFGRVAVRSGFRSVELNEYGNLHKLNCARNDANYGRHIWDRHDSEGKMGAGVSIVIPWFADRYEAGRDWRDLAWWIHDHLPYSEMWFFPKLAAFNLSWREVPRRTISSYIAPKGKLLTAGDEPAEPLADRQARYSDFPALQGIKSPLCG